MNPKPDTSGSYLAIAGVIVAGLAHYGIVTDVGSIATIIGAIVIITGIIKQMIAHKAVVAAVNAQPLSTPTN